MTDTLTNLNNQLKEWELKLELSNKECNKIEETLKTKIKDSKVILKQMNKIQKEIMKINNKNNELIEQEKLEKKKKYYLMKLK
jgi:phage-related protein